MTELELSAQAVAFVLKPTPMAQRKWATAQHAAALAFIAGAKAPVEVMIPALTRLGNVSADRQALEKACIIPATGGDSAFTRAVRDALK